MEEDSEAEEDEKLFASFAADVNIQEEEKTVVKKIEEARQFFCVPINANVCKFDFKKLGES